MNKLTEFEIRQIAEKWATVAGSGSAYCRIRNAIIHAQIVLEEKNRGLETPNVRIQASPVRVNETAWNAMWKHFDRMMEQFGKLFD